MKFTIASVVAVLIGFAAPVGAQEAPAVPTEEFAGAYDFTTTVDGMRVVGTIRLEPAEEGFAGSIDTDLTGRMPIRRTAVVEEGLRIDIDTPNGPGSFLMRLEGDGISGSWQADGMSGEVSGTRRP